VSDKAASAGYPRALTTREIGLINWILPNGSPAYDRMRTQMKETVVLGIGRRGEGELILGRAGELPDISAPLPPVFAYGCLETDHGAISITLRDFLDEQCSLEIVSHTAESVPEAFSELRRWTYSTWRPGSACPQCGQPVREVPMRGEGGDKFTLSICAVDKRIWIFDAVMQVIHLIPVTNFYNELMLHKNIRDPKIALDGKRLFAEHDRYTDVDLAHAFLAYNRLKPRVHIQGGIVTGPQAKKHTWLRRLTQRT